jgi:beta-xylosidase
MATFEAGKAVWQADLGDGRYQNPIIYADYSDPDVVCVGEDFYMTASSFASSPGLPILHSKDLVNWTIISYAVDRLPGGYDGCVRHGDGVWAPSIRYHDGKFWIYFTAPDEGIYMTTAVDPAGPWTPLHMVKEVKGWIDPCPFWDEDGQAYLVHAFARSRTGIKHRLKMCKMSPDGTELLDDGVIVFDGEVDHPTMEGPKMYKRNGYYYIFAPAGGVPVGWQTILRSRSIYGPYEDKIVLHQGDSDVNGPHQGGYVDLPSGESWFIHFQDREAYGRIVHLQPMSWENDWPVMGVDTNGDGIGEPVRTYKKPNVGREYPQADPATTDDFDSKVLGLQWQWQSNRKDEWYSLEANPGSLRLYSQKLPEGGTTLYHAPNMISQKLIAPEFLATAKVTFHPAHTGEKAGLTIFGHDYVYAALEAVEGGVRLVSVLCMDNKSNPGSAEKETASVMLPAGTQTVYFRADCRLEAVFTLQYSLDNETFHTVGEPFTAVPGGWVGAKVGLFAWQHNDAASSGYADVDWLRFEPVEG